MKNRTDRDLCAVDVADGDLERRTDQRAVRVEVEQPEFFTFHLSEAWREDRHDLLRSTTFGTLDAWREGKPLRQFERSLDSSCRSLGKSDIQPVLEVEAAQLAQAGLGIERDAIATDRFEQLSERSGLPAGAVRGPRWPAARRGTSSGSRAHRGSRGLSPWSYGCLLAAGIGSKAVGRFRRPGARPGFQTVGGWPRAGNYRPQRAAPRAGCLYSYFAGGRRSV